MISWSSHVSNHFKEDSCSVHCSLRQNWMVTFCTLEFSSLWSSGEGGWGGTNLYFVAIHATCNTRVQCYAVHLFNCSCYGMMRLIFTGWIFNSPVFKMVLICMKIVIKPNFCAVTYSVHLNISLYWSDNEFLRKCNIKIAQLTICLILV